jgi:site-specific recombinase XerD
MEVAMLERFFLKPQTVDRIMGCWLGPQIELYVTILCEQGYSQRSILRRVPILTEFADFAEARNINQVEQAEALIDAFVVDWVSARRTDRSADARRRDRNFARGIVRHFFSLAISRSECHHTKSSWADPFAAQVPGFFEYLREERGLRSSSIHHYQHYLRRFERYLDQVECCDLGALALPVVTGFVTTTAQEFGSRAMICLASTLRVFLRYANREGVLQRDLSTLIEVPQHYRLADIPRSIGWDAVQKMLDQVERRTVVGRRDYAMLLLMVTYGLRAREVAALMLDDVDWKRDRLHVRERKADHTTAYPLAPVIGEAIIDYLRNGRPDVPSRVLFWRHLAPRSPLTHAAVSSVASKYLHKAGIPVSRPGSHTLRHACVQRLVDSGFPLKIVGDYVGHRSPSSTMIYAKVQIDALREVALGDGEDLQ